MILIYAETQKGKLKKAALEAVTYGYRTGQVLGMECAALDTGEVEDPGQLGKYGAVKVYQIQDPALEQFDSQVFTQAITGAATQLGAEVIVMSHSIMGKSLLGRVAARLEAGSVPGVNAVPTNDGAFRVRRASAFPWRP